MNFYGKNKDKKKKAVVTLAALAIAATIAGTFAWTSYTEWVQNHMQSDGVEAGKVSIIEDFPDQDIDAKVKKIVNVVNSSDTPVLLRMSFEEMLQRLDNDANANDAGYNSIADAGFPVLVNPKEYSAWEDVTDKMTINGAAVTDADSGTDGYKLYKSGSSYSVIYVREMDKSEWPKGFKFVSEPGIKVKDIPTYSGDFKTDQKARVAQKVNGSGTETSTGKYNFTTGSADTSKDIKYYGFGKNLDTFKEADWAGTNVKVSVPAPTPKLPTFAASHVDGDISFDMPNVDANTTDISAATKDWFYNEADGYFYYRSVLPANSTTNTSILDNIIFKTKNNDGVTLEDKFKVASYDLWVGMEAIPAYKSAMIHANDPGQIGQAGDPKDNTKNGSGWGLATTDPIYQYFAAKKDVLD